MWTVSNSCFMWINNSLRNNTATLDELHYRHIFGAEERADGKVFVTYIRGHSNWTFIVFDQINPPINFSRLVPHFLYSTMPSNCSFVSNDLYLLHLLTLTGLTVQVVRCQPSADQESIVLILPKESKSTSKAVLFCASVDSVPTWLPNRQEQQKFQ